METQEKQFFVSRTPKGAVVRDTSGARWLELRYVEGDGMTVSMSSCLPVDFATASELVTAYAEAFRMVQDKDHPGVASAQIKAWPDRPGFWWLKDRWGLSLAESFRHEDSEEDESEWAVLCHTGEAEPQGPFMPRDFGDPGLPEFVWLAEAFPSPGLSSEVAAALSFADKYCGSGNDVGELATRRHLRTLAAAYRALGGNEPS